MSAILTILKALDTGIKESTNKLQISRFPVKKEDCKAKKKFKGYQIPFSYNHELFSEFWR